MNKLLLIVLIVAVLIVIFYNINQKNLEYFDHIPDTQKILIDRLTLENEKLNHIKIVDEQLFKFIRCINIPQTPVCKNVELSSTSNQPLYGQGKKVGNSSVCRSRFIDCNKFRLLLEQDPVAIERMKIATDRYVESDKPQNPSELLQGVQSGWLF